MSRILEPTEEERREAPYFIDRWELHPCKHCGHPTRNKVTYRLRKLATGQLIWEDRDQYPARCGACKAEATARGHEQDAAKFRQRARALRVKQQERALRGKKG